MIDGAFYLAFRQREVVSFESMEIQMLRSLHPPGEEVVQFLSTVAAVVSFTLPSAAWEGRNSSFQREYRGGPG